MKRGICAFLLSLFMVSGQLMADAAVTTKVPEINVAELELRLRPLTRAELKTEADGWLGVLQAKVQEVSTIEIASQFKKAGLSDADQVKRALKDIEDAQKALASEPVKIGMVTTLSTKADYLGEEVRDGFKLAIDQEGGMLCGVTVELLVEDDGRDPGKAKQISDRFMKRDNVKIMTGIIFSNVALAVVPKVVRSDVLYISPNAGPSALAGKGCHENYFNVAYQNDNLDEVVGKYVNDAGFKNVYLLAPNNPAGKDHLAGFKR